MFEIVTSNIPAPVTNDGDRLYTVLTLACAQDPLVWVLKSNLFRVVTTSLTVNAKMKIRSEKG